MCVTDHHEMTLDVKVTFNPNTTTTIVDTITTLREKEKLLVSSNFSFSLNVLLNLYDLYFDINDEKKTPHPCARNQRCFTVLKVPLAANQKDVCLQNTSKSHSHHLKIWHLL